MHLFSSVLSNAALIHQTMVHCLLMLLPGVKLLLIPKGF